MTFTEGLVIKNHNEIAPPHKPIRFTLVNTDLGPPQVLVIPGLNEVDKLNPNDKYHYLIDMVRASGAENPSPYALAIYSACESVRRPRNIKSVTDLLRLDSIKSLAENMEYLAKFMRGKKLRIISHSYGAMILMAAVVSSLSALEDGVDQDKKEVAETFLHSYCSVGKDVIFKSSAIGVLKSHDRAIRVGIRLAMLGCTVPFLQPLTDRLIGFGSPKSDNIGVVLRDDERNLIPTGTRERALDTLDVENVWPTIPELSRPQIERVMEKLHCSLPAALAIHHVKDHLIPYKTILNYFKSVRNWGIADWIEAQGETKDPHNLQHGDILKNIISARFTPTS